MDIATQIELWQLVLATLAIIGGMLGVWMKTQTALTLLKSGQQKLEKDILGLHALMIKLEARKVDINEFDRMCADLNIIQNDIKIVLQRTAKLKVDRE